MKRVPFLLLGLLLLTLVPAFGQEASTVHWWDNRVFYEIFVRSFQDSDGDGIGDLQGVIDRLDYLNDGDPSTTTDLGVTGIWLMPIMESPSYHGYDVTDYRQIEADYGTTEDFLRLVEAAHDRGIAVIVDLVMNHTSREHPWFVESAQGEGETADWYVWADQDPGFRGPTGQEVWHPRDDRFYYGVFWEGMPDLNYETPDVTAEMQAISHYWMETMGVDGFRLDAIKHMIEDGDRQEHTPSTLAWMAEYNAFIDSIDADALTIGEVWSSSFIASRYVPEQVDLVFEFDLAIAMLASVNTKRAAPLLAALDSATSLYPAGQYATFLTNHDQNRVVNALINNERKLSVVASILLTTPGVPFVYYGEEIGMSGQKPDELIRTPMRWDETVTTAGFTSASAPWQPLSEDEPFVSVSAQTNDPDSLLNHYRALIQIRASSSALAHGSYTPLTVANSENILAFVRRSEDETVLVVINLDNDPITDYTLSLEGDATPYTGGDLLYATAGITDFDVPTDGLSAYVPLDTLPPYGTLIVRLTGSDE